MKNHAILVPCQLRAVDENFFSFLDSCIEKSMIFIVTDRDSEEEANCFVLRYGAVVFFMEDIDDTEIGIPLSDVNLLHPEFIKLEVALNRLLAWENEKNHRFEYIHRLRPDVIYPSCFEEFIGPLLNPSRNKNDLLMSWSVIYSGQRDAMLKLIGHTRFQVEYRTDLGAFARISTQIDINPLMRSSNTWPFMSCYPVAILESEANIVGFHERLVIEYPSYIDAAESFAKRLRLEPIPDILYTAAFSDKINTVRCYYRRWQGAIPEHVFFLYLNSLGLSASYYSTDSPLKYSRHATTPFTKVIFNQIQAGDYSFLDASIAWEQEMESFVKAGGKVPFAIQKFSYIDISKLSDESCRSLYAIIDLLDCSSWIFSYSESFFNAIIERGNGMPSTFKQLL